VLEDGFRVLETERFAGPPVILEIVPSEVPQGGEIELTLIGENFTEETAVFIEGGGIEVYDQYFGDPSRLTVSIGELPDASTGPRLVVVESPAGRSELESGLIIVEGGPAPVPTPVPDGGGGFGSLVLWTGSAILVWTAGFVIGRAATLRSQVTWKDLAHLQWQLEARTELPEPRRACTWTCQADASTDALRRWKVKSLLLTPLPVSGGKTPPAAKVSGDALKPLQESFSLRYLLEDENDTRQRLSGVAEAVVKQILAWRQEGQSPASVRLDVQLERDIKWGFKLFHCQKSKKGLTWKEMKKWKGTLHQPAGDCLGVLRGPMADEADFAARAQDEIEAFLLELIKGVRFKP
jgi:hypothetical protein